MGGGGDDPPPTNVAGKKRSIDAVGVVGVSPKKRKVEDVIRDEVKEVFGRLLLREWESVVCPELGVNPECSIHSTLEELRGELNKAGVVGLQSRLVSVAENIVELNQAAIITKATSDLLNIKNPKTHWHCDFATLRDTFADSLSTNDLRRLSSRVLSNLLAKSLFEPTPETVEGIVKMYEESKLTMVEIAEGVGLPPLTVARLVLETRRNLICSKKLWANPEKYISDKRDRESVVEAQKVDSITSENLQWERKERTYMVEKAFEKYCKLKGMKVLIRNKMPLGGFPKPSMFVSPCTVDGLKCSWFEVVGYYGLLGNLEDFTGKRIKVLESKYGPGCVLMPYGYDENFGKSWTSIVIDPVKLDINLIRLDSALDDDLSLVRATFLRNISNWTLETPADPPVGIEPVSELEPIQPIPELPEVPPVPTTEVVLKSGNQSEEEKTTDTGDRKEPVKEPVKATTPKKPARGSRMSVATKRFQRVPDHTSW